MKYKFAQKLKKKPKIREPLKVLEQALSNYIINLNCQFVRGQKWFFHVHKCVFVSLKFTSYILTTTHFHQREIKVLTVNFHQTKIMPNTYRARVVSHSNGFPYRSSTGQDPYKSNTPVSVCMKWKKLKQCPKRIVRNSQLHDLATNWIKQELGGVCSICNVHVPAMPQGSSSWGKLNPDLECPHIISKTNIFCWIFR